MKGTGPLLALAAALVVAGALAIAWVAGAFDGGEARASRPVVAVTIDPSAPVVALEARAATLEAAQAAVGSGELDALLAQDPLALDFEEVTQAGVTLRDVVVRRDGADAWGEATVDPAALAALAPGDVELAYDEEASADAGALVLSGTASALGIDVPVSVAVGVQDGRVVASPQGLPVGDTVLFEDPRVVVTGLEAEPADDGLLRVRAEAQVVG